MPHDTRIHRLNRFASAAPPARPPTQRRWVRALVGLALILGIWAAVVILGRDPGDAPVEIKRALIRAMHDKGGMDVRALVLRRDLHAAGRPNGGYSGTATLADGRNVAVELWVERVTGPKGASDLLHWTTRGAPATATTAPSPATPPTTRPTTAPRHEG